ncbi:unnamed protein product, partial [Mycena citricolor]
MMGDLSSYQHRYDPHMASSDPGGSSQPSLPNRGVTTRSPLPFFVGLEKVHRDELARDEIQTGLMAVTPLIHKRLVRTTSLKTTYSGGDTLKRTDEGWMKTSSLIPMAREQLPKNFQLQFAWRLQLRIESSVD